MWSYAVAAVNALALASCGRIDFDPLSGGGGDAPGIPGVCGTRTTASVVVGSLDACMVRLDGTLWCAGSDYQPVFRQLGTSNRWLRVDGEETSFCALDIGCELSCWGHNNDGEVGTGDRSPSLAPIAITPGTRYRDLGAGGFHTCAIREDGIMFCWGRNAEGALGLGDMTDRLVPTQMGAQTWKSIARGYLFTCGFDSLDRLLCWGSDDSGQIGIGQVGTNILTPAIVPPQLAAWATASGGKQHICARDTSRHLYCWGHNDFGEVGRGDVVPQTSPSQVGTDTDWDQVGIGRFTSCATKLDRTLWCWGDNGEGAVGVPGNSMWATPQRIASPAHWSVIPPGNTGVCALDDTGALYCWGTNDSGQLGFGDLLPRDVPTRVPLP